jgi:hypothetical protein
MIAWNIEDTLHRGTELEHKVWREKEVLTILASFLRAYIPEGGGGVLLQRYVPEGYLLQCYVLGGLC